MSNDLIMLYVAILKYGCPVRMSRLNEFPETKPPDNQYIVTIENQRTVIIQNRKRTEDMIRVRLKPNE